MRFFFVSGKFEIFSESMGKIEIYFKTSYWALIMLENLSGCVRSGKFEVLSDTSGKFEEFFRRKRYE